MIKNYAGTLKTYKQYLLYSAFTVINQRWDKCVKIYVMYSKTMEELRGATFHIDIEKFIWDYVCEW